MFIYCEKSDKKGVHARRVHASVCQARSVGESRILEMRIPDASGYTYIDRCLGCTKWIDQLEEEQQEASAIAEHLQLIEI